MIHQASTVLELPSDVAAERVVVGCAIDSPQAARYASELEAADFTVDSHRRLWRAALACELPFRCDGSRTRSIADGAGVAFEVAEDMRRRAPTLDDRTGFWAGRVRDATRRRRLLAELAELHDSLAAGGDLNDAMAGLERAWRVGVGELVGVLAGPEALKS